MDVPTELLSPKNMTNRNLQSCRSKSNSYLQRPDNRETYWICTARPNKPRRCGKSEPGAALQYWSNLASSLPSGLGEAPTLQVSCHTEQANPDF